MLLKYQTIDRAGHIDLPNHDHLIVIFGVLRTPTEKFQTQ
jgi:hypothetical protein